MLRKMFEQALGELMEEMAPTRPTIDPVDQRRRPDMSQRPTEGEMRRAVGQARPEPLQPAQSVERARPVQPVRPAAGADRRRPVNPRDQEGRLSNMGEGRNAPREIAQPEGRLAFREPTIPRDVRPEANRPEPRPSIAVGAPITVTIQRTVNPFRAQLTSQASVRNAFRIMEILRPPVALRDIPGSESNR